MPAAGAPVLEAKHLTKKFGGVVALDDVSFEVGAGEIVGVLGANGAGKTTLMRVITGYLPATLGKVAISGLDVERERGEALKRAGYLQENIFLFSEMRVDKYLWFRGALKGLRGRRLAERLAEVKAACGLEEEGRTVIGRLSRGFRQRVALADSLLADPEVLVLDAPTAGLDALQTSVFREFLAEFSQDRAVLISFSLPAEAEQICTRVLVLKKGRLVADDTLQNLTAQQKGNIEVSAEIYGPYHAVLGRLSEARGVLRATCIPQAGAAETEDEADIWAEYRIECVQGSDLRLEIPGIVAQNGWMLRELSLKRKTLEDVFAELNA